MAKKRAHQLLRLFVLLMATSVTTASADDGSGHEGKTTPAILRPVMALKRLIDTMAVSGIDRNYIDVPKLPWQVILRGNVNQTYLKMQSQVDIGTAFTDTPLDNKILWEPHIKNEPSAYVGLWIGYRGYGFGYSHNVAGDPGSYLTFGVTGGSYGVNLRIHSFRSSNPRIHYYSDLDESLQGNEEMELDDPIKVRTVIFDGYYLFNGRHFSYAAAYDQSAVQLRSAGSWMVGMMYYYGHIDYATAPNAPFMLFMDNIGQMRQWQLCLGGGYAYNWVPARGWLFSALFMPMVGVYNRVKFYKYDSNLRDVLEDSEDLDVSKLRISPKEEASRVSNLQLNFDTRVSMTYQWDRYFINAYGQLNNFRYEQDENKGYLTDWLAWLQLGVRF